MSCPRRAGARCEAAATYFPVVFDNVYDRVRSKWLTLAVVSLLLDQLYLSAIVGTPNCTDMWATMTAPNANAALQLGATQEAVAGFTAPPTAPLDITRLVAVLVAALANAVYQGPAWLLVAGGMLTGYVVADTAVEVPACFHVAAHCVALQEEVTATAAAAASAAAAAAGSNSSSVTPPISFMAMVGWFVFTQHMLLWLVAVSATAIVWRLAATAHRARATACLRKVCRRSQAADGSAAPASATATPLLPSAATSATATLPSTSAPRTGCCRRFADDAGSLPQRLQAAIVFAAVVLVLLSLSMVATLATFASWLHFLLGQYGTLTTMAENLANYFGDDTTTALFDTVLSYLRLGLEAAYSLLAAVATSAALTAAILVYELVHAVSRYAAILRFYAARSVGDGSAADTPALESPGAPTSPLPSPPPLRGSACSRCTRAVRRALSALCSCRRPYGVRSDGTLDFPAFSFYTALSFVPFYVANIVLAFALLTAVFTVLFFIIIFKPTRDSLISYVLSFAIVASFLASLIQFTFFNRCLSTSARIKRPRWFLFFDIAYSTTVALATGLISAGTRVVANIIWSAIHCIRLEAPLLPGELARLDSGWAMHGSLLKCRFTAGSPPPPIT